MPDIHYKYEVGASLGTGRRFDSVSVSRHWVLRHIEHLYEEGIAAGGDHAPVVVDLDLTVRFAAFARVPE